MTDDQTRRQRTVPQTTYRISEVCDITGLGRTTVYKLIKEGRLDAVRVTGRLVLIPAKSLDEFLTGLPSMQAS